MSASSEVTSVVKTSERGSLEGLSKPSLPLAPFSSFLSSDSMAYWEVLLLSPGLGRTSALLPLLRETLASKI